MTADQEDPDLLYQPLDGPETWEAVSASVDEGDWATAAGRLVVLDQEAPAWTDMVRRGMQLAAAYHSGGLAGLYPVDDGLGRRLVAGVATAAGFGPDVERHIRDNHAALLLAAGSAGSPPTDALLRRLHAVGCRSQVFHVVDSPAGPHDHVLGHGDYKHHPNHRRLPAGQWEPLVPVAAVATETAGLVTWLGSDAFAALQPAARAAYALHAVTHVGPFATGNGRVARALAGGLLLDAVGIPLSIPSAGEPDYRRALAAAGAGDREALASFVVRSVLALAALVDDLRVSAGGADEIAALERWRAQVETAQRLHGLVTEAAGAALDRHRARGDLGWMADLSGATVAAHPAHLDEPRYAASPVCLRVRLAGGQTVEEALVIDAHPVDGDGEAVALRAVEAELGLTVQPAEVARPATVLARRLDDLLDRAVAAYAVRVAAEDEG